MIIVQGESIIYFVNNNTEYFQNPHITHSGNFGQTVNDELIF